MKEAFSFLFAGLTAWHVLTGLGDAWHCVFHKFHPPISTLHFQLWLVEVGRAVHFLCSLFPSVPMSLSVCVSPQPLPAALIALSQTVCFLFPLLQGILNFDQMCFEKYGKIWG